MALNKDYIHAKKEIHALRHEKNTLLDNIDRLESVDRLTDDSSDSDNLVDSDLSDSSEEDYDLKTILENKAKQKTASPTFPPPRTVHKSNYTSISTPTIINKLNTTHTTSKTTTNDESPSSLRLITTIPSAPPKRSKINTLKIQKVRRVQPIERDEHGKPKLPQEIGVLTVHSLGKIINDRPAYHNERYIFPVGYTVSRTYPSMIDPDKNTIVTSTILDGGDAPRFHVVAADLPNEPIIANSATGAWTVIVRRANDIRHRDHSNSASGPDYYGFKHPTIANLIQELPGAKELPSYIWQEFEEMEPRAAKGVMAAAEKKRGNLEQMGNANRKIPKTTTSSAAKEEADPAITQKQQEDNSTNPSVFANEPVDQGGMNDDAEAEIYELIATDDEQ
ncbi:F/Y-rich N-terminus-domain-containing protein [Mycotypha africana]|uniref:F/Y-rich N-terminus-domain-containing protein n=1 Tax=Mycotypha africana TaxID=64632 RepID=UPI0023013812|nr:F/Y-rich N-terminus-domain-containing protein [Mycotypha africana]KAI8991569.1 F/Y-rich N-terminus-domain-containing protein [Mycotypha africana]